jgi:hypothetical protein
VGDRHLNFYESWDNLAVAQINDNRGPRCEVAAWSAPGMHSRRLSITGTRVWCHWLGPDDYKVVADLTNYAAEI